MMWYAFLVDAMVYLALGALLVWVGKKRLPAPWNQVGFTIPLFLVVGLILSLLTYPHWLVHPN